MTTDASTVFWSGLDRAAQLSKIAAQSKLPIADRQVFYHADLAAAVAAWDNYINTSIVEFVSKIGDYSDPDLERARQWLQTGLTWRMDKFNTPNYEICQRLFLETIELDIIPHWVWQRRNLNATMVKERLNQILKLRHSFAHGFTLPSYSWLPQRAGTPYLNRSVLMNVHDLLRHLVERTEKALDNQMTISFGKNRW